MNHIVCDTNVLISGLLWNGAPARIADRVESGADALFITRELLDELANVLGRAKFVQALTQSDLEVEDILRWVVGHSAIILAKPLPSIIVKNDPADDRVLACALACGADFIISGDRHLLELHTWSEKPIISPSEYLKRICR